MAFFSQEFVRLFKKLFSIPGGTLLLPLVLASIVVAICQDLSLWLLLRYQALLDRMINALASLFPFKTVMVLFISIVYLFIIAILPGWIFRYRSKLKNSHESPFYIYWLGLILWLIAAILLIVSNRSLVL